MIQKRKLPPPTPVTVYELTEYGKGLSEALYALARWGARTLGPPKDDDELYPEWGVNALPALFNPRRPAASPRRTSSRSTTTCSRHGSSTAPSPRPRGAAEDADLVLETDMQTFFRLPSATSSRRPRWRAAVPGSTAISRRSSAAFAY